jgi:diguanylate cyclase (GGDEF)-like protein
MGRALAIAFLLLTSIVMIVGYLGLRGMTRLHADAQNIAATQWEDVQIAVEALDCSNQNSRVNMQIVLADNRREVESLLARRAANEIRISALINQLQTRIGSAREKKLLDAVIETRSTYEEASDSAIDVFLSVQGEDRARPIQVSAPLLARYHVAWSDFIRFQTAEMNQQLSRSAVAYAADRERTTYLMILAVALAVGIAVFEVRKTVSEIRNRTTAEIRLRDANEDLELRVHQRTADLEQSIKDLTVEIAQRQEVEENLVSKTAFLEAQSNSTIDGVLVVDGNNRKLLQNQRFIDIFQIPSEIVENDGAALAFVLDQIAQPDQFTERVKYFCEHPEESGRDEILLKTGIVLERYSAPVVAADGNYYGRIWNFRDITDRKRAEERIHFLAYYDALTALPNRSLLQDRLGKALAIARRRREKVALLFLDLDHFKVINDSLGHSVGDLLLQQVGERLAKCTRDQDTVARVGGDEFLIVLTGVKEVADAGGSAERIMNAMHGEFVVQGHTLSISCSIGIGIFPEHGADPESLIKNADAAMYGAKDNGRSRFQFFTEGMNAQAVERLSLENSLRSGLEKGEFFLVYQPQIAISTGKIIGAEALLRWRHPELGLVSPDKFIRVAEKSGLIIPIGEWVLRTACSQARQWQADGLQPLTVAVNVSAVQFRQESFRELIRGVLHETGLAPQYLELELTESLLLSNKDVTFSVLHELEEMGVKLAIDDFGTGYSSLSYLKTFPVTKLKIDRSFIRELTVNPDDAAITIAIISMAKSLNLKVIAEGVETEAQMSFLRENHCDEIQGYYFSKPVSADELAKKLPKSSTPQLVGDLLTTASPVGI